MSQWRGCPPRTRPASPPTWPAWSAARGAPAPRSVPLTAPADGGIALDQPSPKVVLVRHGETEWSRDGRHTGRSDIPLTDRGRDEARCLAAALARREFTRVLCSPLQRARETCALAGFADRAELRDELMEWDYGEYEGLTLAQVLAARPGWFLWRDGCPGGEAPAGVGRRVDPLVAELRGAAGDVLAFAHGHLLRVLASRWIEQPPAHGAHLALGTAAVCALGWEHAQPTLQRWNDRSHLPAERRLS